MFGIGDFARLGRVSVRMLRHYDALGLLPPSRVDESTGYRYYSAERLARLNRLVALKDLGFSLREVEQLLDESVPPARLEELLRQRRADLEATIAADRSRLAEVGRRLRAIAAEGAAPRRDVVVRDLPPVRLAELSAPADSYAPDDISPVIRPLFARLCGMVGGPGLSVTGPAVAYYEPRDDAIMVHAGLPVNAPPGEHGEVRVVDLPPITAATVVHHGPMDDADAVAQDLARWIEANGYRSGGLAREISLDCPEDESEWVTELQEPILVAA